MSEQVSADVLGLTATIVSAHVGNNTVETGALLELIQSVYRSLATAGQAEAPVAVQEPAVPPKRSVFPDYIICLEDGAKLKMLKRYLKTRYGMTPQDYRSKWHLPSDYPMVAPTYAKRRSELARQIGLGLQKPAVAAEPTPKVLPAKRARGLKRK